MDSDGSNVRKVFDKWKRRTSPTWSPDGKRIAYSSGEPGSQSIYIGTIDGKTEERVAIGCCPAWSPDGREIAFVVGALREPKRISLLNSQTHRHRFFFPLSEHRGFGILLGPRLAINLPLLGTIALNFGVRISC